MQLEAVKTVKKAITPGCSKPKLNILQLEGNTSFSCVGLKSKHDGYTTRGSELPMLQVLVSMPFQCRGNCTRYRKVALSIQHVLVFHSQLHGLCRSCTQPKAKTRDTGDAALAASTSVCCIPSTPQTDQSHRSWHTILIQ